MAKEFLPDGRVVEGGSTDVKGRVTLNPNELDGLKAQMYKDFLTAKQEGKIGLSYTFDSWLRDSCNTLRSLRKADLETEYKLGKISKAEFDALDEMRVKMISAIIQMDVSGLDKYGIQYIDPTFAQIAAGRASTLDNRLLIPSHRKDVIKFKNEIIK